MRTEQWEPGGYGQGIRSTAFAMRPDGPVKQDFLKGLIKPLLGAGFPPLRFLCKGLLPGLSQHEREVWWCVWQRVVESSK